MDHEIVDAGSPFLGERSLFRLGGAGAREHIWIQADALASPGAMVLGTWTILDSLLGSRVNQHRHLVLGRAEIAVLAPPRASLTSSEEPPPLLDAGRLGAQGAVLAAMRRFAPTLVIHLQDRSTSRPAGEVSGGAAEVCLVESFFLDPKLHAALAARPPGKTWLRRPSKTARFVSEHPDARLGRFALRYARRQTGAGIEAERTREVRSTASTIRIGNGRYIPQPALRAIGGASLCEIALREYGAAGLCGLLTGGDARERARAALALAEAAVLQRLGLAAEEVPS